MTFLVVESITDLAKDDPFPSRLGGLPGRRVVPLVVSIVSPSKLQCKSLF